MIGDGEGLGVALAVAGGVGAIMAVSIVVGVAIDWIRGSSDWDDSDR